MPSSLVGRAAGPALSVPRHRGYSFSYPGRRRRRLHTHFGGGKDDTAHGICIFRNWSFIVAGIVIIILLGIITLTVLARRSPSSSARSREIVEEQNDVTLESHSVLRSQEPAPSVAAPARVTPGIIGSGGYKSKDESFYNFSTKTSNNAEAGSLLYAPRVTFDPSVTGSTGARAAKEEARLLAAATASRR